MDAIITKDEFIDSYMKATNIDPAFRTPEGFRKQNSPGKVALRCYCGDPICRGWVMIYNDPEDIAFHKESRGSPTYKS